MDRWHSIQLNSLWLTRDNASDGDPIINEIENIAVLKRGRTGQVNLALDGTVWKQRFPVKGAPLIIRFNLIESDDFEALTLLLNAADSGSNISFTITGDTGTYYGTATTGDDYLNFDSTFLNGRVAGVVVGLILVTQNHVMTASASSYTLTGQNATLTYSGA